MLELIAGVGPGLEPLAIPQAQPNMAPIVASSQWAGLSFELRIYQPRANRRARTTTQISGNPVIGT